MVKAVGQLAVGVGLPVRQGRRQAMPGQVMLEVVTSFHMRAAGHRQQAVLGGEVAAG